MSDQPQPTNTEATTASIEHKMRERLDALTEEQQEQLSKALFPETHTAKVTLCDKERMLRPLPVKFSRQINVKLSQFQKLVAEGQSDTKVVDIDLLDTMLETCTVLATFYEWEDVLEKIVEEEIYMPELQELLVQQTYLQDTNDFLLMPLRILVVVMQQAEIEMIHLQNTFSGLRSSNITSVPSTS